MGLKTIPKTPYKSSLLQKPYIIIINYTCHPPPVINIIRGTAFSLGQARGGLKIAVPKIVF